MNKVNIGHLNHEHNDWLRSLKFYKNEISLLKDRLTQICNRHATKEIAVNLEHFENQFTIQERNINSLGNNIKQVVNKTAVHIVPSSGLPVDEITVHHETLRDKFIQEERIIHELRHEFNRFAATCI